MCFTGQKKQKERARCPRNDDVLEGRGWDMRRIIRFNDRAIQSLTFTHIAWTLEVYDLMADPQSGDEEKSASHGFFLIFRTSEVPL